MRTEFAGPRRRVEPQEFLLELLANTIWPLVLPDGLGRSSTYAHARQFNRVACERPIPGVDVEETISCVTLGVANLSSTARNFDVSERRSGFPRELSSDSAVAGAYSVA